LNSGQQWSTEATSSYNALQVELTRRIGRGLQFRGNYTWSKDLDSASGLASSNSSNTPQYPQDSYHIKADWGPSAYNTTNQASGNFSYELPIGKGKPWLTGVSGAADKVVSGWQVNGIVTLLSGLPMTPVSGSNRSGNGQNGSNADRPNVNPAFTGPVIVGSVSEWFNPNAYLLPTAGTYGNVSKGSLTEPGLADFDFSLFKITRISERIGTEFRAEFFNIVNHTNLGTPNPQVFNGTAISPTAGAACKRNRRKLCGSG